jgi:hypothetical protein
MKVVPAGIGNDDGHGAVMTEGRISPVDWIMFQRVVTRFEMASEYIRVPVPVFSEIIMA